MAAEGAGAEGVGCTGALVPAAGAEGRRDLYGDGREGVVGCDGDSQSHAGGKDGLRAGTDCIADECLVASGQLVGPRHDAVAITVGDCKQVGARLTGRRVVQVVYL